MVVYIRYGTRLYGKVDAFAGTHVATKFFHIYYVPLIPISSWLVFGDGRALPLPMHGRSVIAAYLRGVVTVAAVASAIGMFMFISNPYRSLTVDNAIANLLLPVVAAALAVVGWGVVGRLDVDGKAQRAAYFDAIGLFADPALLGIERSDLADRLRADLSSRAQAFATSGYRDAWDPDTAWRKLATTDAPVGVEFRKQALTLARLEWSLAEPPRKAVLASEHAAMWAQLKQSHPEVMDVERYQLV